MRTKYDKRFGLIFLINLTGDKTLLMLEMANTRMSKAWKINSYYFDQCHKLALMSEKVNNNRNIWEVKAMINSCRLD